MFSSRALQMRPQVDDTVQIKNEPHLPLLTVEAVSMDAHGRTCVTAYWIDSHGCRRQWTGLADHVHLVARRESA